MGEEALPLEDYQESLPVHPSAQAAGRAPQFRGRRPTSVRASMAMKGNRSRGTEPELMLRRALWGLGLRYRLHAVDLPGKPDIVFRRQKVAVFVDGDFWHGRDWERLQTKLSRGANADYWVRKIEYNRKRARKCGEELAQQGWHVVRVWESAVLHDVEEAVGIIGTVLEQRRH